MTERHCLSVSSPPMPNVLSASWRNFSTFSLRLPSSTSTTCAAPKRWPVRTMQERSFCAATVASHVFGGFRQMSQLPQSVSSTSPK